MDAISLEEICMSKPKFLHFLAILILSLSISLFNGPGVAGAVLQTPPLLIH